MKCRIKHSSIIIRDMAMRPKFIMDFYGDDAHKLTWIPGGGNLVATALKRHGINPDKVFFTVWDVTIHS